MQALILALAVLLAASGGFNLWNGDDDIVIMTDGANPIPPKG